MLWILGWTLEAMRPTTLRRREGGRERDMGSSKVWGSLVMCWDLHEVMSTSVQNTELKGVISTEHPTVAHSSCSLRLSTLTQLQDNLHTQNSVPSAPKGDFYGRTF